MDNVLARKSVTFGTDSLLNVELLTETAGDFLYAVSWERREYGEKVVVTERGFKRFATFSQAVKYFNKLN